MNFSAQVLRWAAVVAVKCPLVSDQALLLTRRNVISNKGACKVLGLQATNLLLPTFSWFYFLDDNSLMW